MKELELSQGFKTYVDNKVYDKVKIWKWYYHKGRAIRTVWFRDDDGKLFYRKIYLARYIMNCPPHLFVDHIDGNPLNNTMRNLRICTKAENCRNRKKIEGRSSKYKGVSFKDGRFHVAVTRNYIRHHVGSFATEIEAAIAYNKKAIELFGEFAKLNDIPEDSNTGLGGLASASGNL